MKLLFDLSYTQGFKFYSGLHEYGKRVFKQLCFNKVSFSVMLVKDLETPDWIKEIAPKIEYIDAKRDSRRYYNIIEKLSYSYDRIYFPYQLVKHKYKLSKNCELVFTIHDLAQIDLSKNTIIVKQEKKYLISFKEKIIHIIKQCLRITGIWHYFLFSSLKYNLSNALKIIVVSESTKNDILNRFKIDERKINICYSPVKVDFYNSSSKLEYSNYFLFVSASRYTKNTYRGLKALDEIWGDNKDFPNAIVCGALSPTVMKDIKNKAKIINLPYVPSEDLEYLYKNANALIFPSLAEGFGMPPLEAMKYGTKVVCSNLPCLKELFPNCLFFDPYDVSDIKSKILVYNNLKSEDMIDNYNVVINKSEKDIFKICDVVSK